MPTIISHAAVPLAIGMGLGRAVIPVPLLAAGIAVAALPDIDVIGFSFGIPYGDPLGHRGASHALFTAALVAAAGVLCFRRRPILSFLFLFVAMASHGLLDMLTDGGRGVALLWPFSERRLFAPVTPVEVSPIGLRNFLSGRGRDVMASELLWIWAPAVAVAVVLRLFGRTSLRGDAKAGRGYQPQPREDAAEQ